MIRTYIRGTTLRQDHATVDQSVEFRTASVVDNIKKRLHQDLLCTCSENEIRQSKFIKSLTASTTRVDGRIQVMMPWTEASPPKQSNYGISLKRMFSAERSLQKMGVSMLSMRKSKSF